MVIRRTVDPPAADDEGSARPDDRETLARVAAGDVRALGVLYDRFGEAVHSLALHVVGDPAVAEAVTREVFLAVRHAGRLDPAFGSVATWLLTTARHRAVEARRRESGAQRRTEAPLPGRGAELTPEQRAVVGLAYFEGFTHTEIASMRGRPADAVLADAAEALTLLRPDADAPGP